MTHQIVRPRGHMTLTLLDATGAPIAEYANSNRVLNGGKGLLLDLLNKAVVIESYEMILGAKGFNPDADDPLAQETAVPVKRSKAPTKNIKNGELVVGFQGNITRDAQVQGGGLVISGKRGTKEFQALYNFAATPAPIDMSNNQSVSVTFRLAME